MPTRDIRSDLLPIRAFNEIITTNTTTLGDIIDLKDFDGGFMYTLIATVYGAGTYTPIIEESDDSGMAGATDVADINLIGTEAGAVITSAAAAGEVLPSIGAFGTKRFQRLKILSASASTTTILALAIAKPELRPSDLLSA